jgi:hypothetical protein
LQPLDIFIIDRNEKIDVLGCAGIAINAYRSPTQQKIADLMLV